MSRLFRKYSVQTQTKLVRDNNDGAPAEEEFTFDPMLNIRIAAEYSEIAKDFITHATLTIGGVYAACKIIARICK